VKLACLDLEGVLIPEMWIRVAEETGIEELRVTTRDIADYDELMCYRLGILERQGVKLPDILKAISDVQPLPGAIEFLAALRTHCQVVILSDTYVEFMGHMLGQLDWPFLLCNELETDDEGRITNYRLRQQDGKRRAVEAFKSLNVHTVAAGDSFNDISMIREADAGVLFKPSDAVVSAHPDLPVANDYTSLLDQLRSL